jgi:multisubunit Na+/H+ antiporter MnhB subunit
MEGLEWLIALFIGLLVAWLVLRWLRHGSDRPDA